MNTNNFLNDIKNDLDSYKLDQENNTNVRENNLRYITLKYKIRCEFDQKCLDIIFNDEIIRTMPELEDLLYDDRYTYCDIDEYKNFHSETVKRRFKNAFKRYTFNCLTNRKNLSFFYKLRSDAMSVRIISNGQDKIESFFFNKYPIIPECLEQKYLKLFRAHEKFKNLLKFKTTEDFKTLTKKNHNMTPTPSSRAIRMIFDENENLPSTKPNKNLVDYNTETIDSLISSEKIFNATNIENYDLEALNYNTEKSFNNIDRNNTIWPDNVEIFEPSLNRFNNSLIYDKNTKNFSNAILYSSGFTLLLFFFCIILMNNTNFKTWKFNLSTFAALLCILAMGIIFYFSF